ncbi:MULTISPECIES: SCP2 domain-containing protein [Janthinobacterium]|uniref:Ubiquinone biosynthesis accessory factor UbiJ n=1 Tax=Janthinobacterium lividum TaxID=29581 RepID=A0AAJ4MUH0_9BURK|nr:MULTISPECIES: SCP2 sterol-binding domain-containing protein [Janthinobacterium]KAB0330855.1 sterol-binding protein [Janthinobacterium lividum]MBR7636653.1 SCP2 sterol-binding domain-containing protein [Janthinobacterium lividum]MCC7715624.1 SCP2 sterol-binding domain-containing protein [Janthinobacterium lividum]MDO8036406.1 SCP2 sterol-binding domain-containing protein [Janthinobacterium sp. SUN128]PHV19355.1 sterol-binding protein [Janthinobacterium sp. BJB446]
MAPLPDLSLMTPVIATINHLLAQEPWARQQLAVHAGKLACIDTGAVALRLRVDSAGMLEAAPADMPANVTIRVKLSDVPLILQNRERAFSYVKIEGDAEFANAISQLSKGLRWEAEHDLEKVVGPMLATRLVAGARDAAAFVRTGQQKLAENVAEYFLDEQPMLIRPSTLQEYSAGVTRVRDDVERLAKRLARLEKAAAAVQPQSSSPDLST